MGRHVTYLKLFNWPAIHNPTPATQIVQTCRLEIAFTGAAHWDNNGNGEAEAMTQNHPKSGQKEDQRVARWRGMGRGSGFEAMRGEEEQNKVRDTFYSGDKQGVWSLVRFASAASATLGSCPSRPFSIPSCTSERPLKTVRSNGGQRPNGHWPGLPVQARMVARIAPPTRRTVPPGCACCSCCSETWSHQTCAGSPPARQRKCRS